MIKIGVIFSLLIALSSANSATFNIEKISQNTENNIQYAQSVDSYYSSIDSTKKGTALRSEVAQLITSTHKTNPTYAQLPSIFNTTDADPETGSGILMFYTGTKFNSYSAANANREHVWPKNAGNAFPETSDAGSDAHHLRPTAQDLNSTRQSYNFDEVPQTAANIVKENGSSSYGDTDHMCYKSGDSFYPAKGYRGATARILMYVQARWGDTYNLTFVDYMGYNKTMGKISTLIKWHLEEPVTDAEIYRNEKVYAIQGNRNPFIDHPEYAVSIYGYDGQSYNTAVLNVAKTYGEASEPTLTSLSLNYSNVSLSVNETTALSVTANPTGASNSCTWSSSNSSIVSVDSNGTIKGLKKGAATITATSTVNTSISCSCNVNVLELDSISISGTLSKTSYNAGDKFDPTGLIVTAKYSDKSTKIIDNNACSWLDSNTSSETLSKGTTSVICTYNGKTAIYEGITVTTSNDYTLVANASDIKTGDKIIIASTSYNVVAGKISGTYLSPVSATFSSDDTKLEKVTEDMSIFTVYKSGSNYTLKSDEGTLSCTGKKSLSYTSGTSTWTISISDTNATIKSTSTSYGTIIYNGGAPRFTTYASTNQSMVLPQIFKLSSSEEETINVTGVSLSKSSLDLHIDEEFTLVASVLPSNATNKNITWESLDPSIATVSYGVVKALKAGSTNINVKTQDGNFIATCTINVKNNISKNTYNIKEFFNYKYFD